MQQSVASHSGIHNAACGTRIRVVRLRDFETEARKLSKGPCKAAGRVLQFVSLHPVRLYKLTVKLRLIPGKIGHVQMVQRMSSDFVRSVQFLALSVFLSPDMHTTLNICG